MGRAMSRALPLLLIGASGGCVVAVDETITINQPVDEIVIGVTAGDVKVFAHDGPVELSGDFGGAGRGPIGHDLVDGVLTIQYDCRLCGGQLTIECPPETVITADVGGGDLTVSSMSGAVTASLGGGTARVKDHGAGPVSIATDVGDADVSFVERPAWVDVSLGTGTIGIDLPAGAYALELDAPRGLIQVSGVTDDPSNPNTITAYAGTGSIGLTGN